MSHNMVFECEAVLSKKLEAVCESGEPISIYVTSVSGNKGRALIRMTCKSGTSENDVKKIGETSLGLKILSVSDDIKALGEDAKRFTNLVEEIPTDVQTKVAQVSPDVKAGEPYNGQVGKATLQEETLSSLLKILQASGITIPLPSNTQAHSEVKTSEKIVEQKTAAKTPAPQENCIMAYNELMAEIVALPMIDKMPKFPEGRKLTPMEAASIDSQLPKLRRKAYLRNNMQSQLMIGDLFTSIDGTGQCLTMLPGAAFDLTRIPARNILNSSDLKWCFDTSKVELVNGATFVASFKKVESDITAWDRGGIPVYGGTSSRISPNEQSEGVAESLASGSAIEDDGSIVVNERASDSIAIESTDRPPESIYEGDTAMQQLMGGLPKERQPRERSPIRSR